MYYTNEDHVFDSLCVRDCLQNVQICFVVHQVSYHLVLRALSRV
jgi:hypothetical protein